MIVSGGCLPADPLPSGTLLPWFHVAADGKLLGIASKKTGDRNRRSGVTLVLWMGLWSEEECQQEVHPRIAIPLYPWENGTFGCSERLLNGLEDGEYLIVLRGHVVVQKK
jgi:hypothetical protein